MSNQEDQLVAQAIMSPIMSGDSTAYPAFALRETGYPAIQLLRWLFLNSCVVLEQGWSSSIKNTDNKTNECRRRADGRVA
jgi:hypothetical protein